jgi:hypothetical protein
MLVLLLLSSNQQNCLITKVLNKGDVFVFPIGFIHFQLNVGYGNAVVIVRLSAKIQVLSLLLMLYYFGSNPKISLEIHFKAFQVDINVVKKSSKTILV